MPKNLTSKKETETITDLGAVQSAQGSKNKLDQFNRLSNLKASGK